MEISTPGVLENPGFEAWPPDLTANGVLVEPIIFICMDSYLKKTNHPDKKCVTHTTAAVSLVEPTSTAHAEA